MPRGPKKNHHHWRNNQHVTVYLDKKWSSSAMCLNIRSDMLKIRYAKIRLGPIWAKAHMGQGPYGPRAPGPRALPCWANTSPKNAPWKKESKLCFLCVFWKQKRCATSVRSFWRRYRAEIFVICWKRKKVRDVHRIILEAVSRRDLCYVSENKGFRFWKIHIFVRYLSICEFATRRRLWKNTIRN